MPKSIPRPTKPRQQTPTRQEEGKMHGPEERGPPRPGYDSDWMPEMGPEAPLRQLSSMTEEEKKRYDAALRARQEEAVQEPTESVMRRYGLDRPVANPYLPQPAKCKPTSTIPTTRLAEEKSRELAERYKQFHSASPGPVKDYYAQRIAELQDTPDAKETVKHIIEEIDPLSVVK